MSQPIERTAIFTVSYASLAWALGQRSWTGTDDDLSGDPYSDIFCKKVPFYPHSDNGKLIKDFLPQESSFASEEIKRNKMAESLGELRRKFIVESLKKINVSGDIYVGVDENGNPVDVDLPASIESVNVLDTLNVELTIVNPEHLINYIINGVGKFYPHTVIATKALGDAKLIEALLSNIDDFYSVYGVYKADHILDCPLERGVYNEAEVIDYLKECEPSSIHEELCESAIAFLDKGEPENNLISKVSTILTILEMGDQLSEVKKLISEKIDLKLVDHEESVKKLKGLNAFLAQK